MNEKEKQILRRANPEMMYKKQELKDKAWKAYHKIHAPLLEAYDKEVASARKAYKRAISPAWKALKKSLEEIDKMK